MSLTLVGEVFFCQLDFHIKLFVVEIYLITADTSIANKVSHFGDTAQWSPFSSNVSFPSGRLAKKGSKKEEPKLLPETGPSDIFNCMRRSFRQQANYQHQIDGKVFLNQMSFPLSAAQCPDSWRGLRRGRPSRTCCRSSWPPPERERHPDGRSVRLQYGGFHGHRP